MLLNVKLLKRSNKQSNILIVPLGLSQPFLLKALRTHTIDTLLIHYLPGETNDTLFIFTINISLSLFRNHWV